MEREIETLGQHSDSAYFALAELLHEVRENALWQEGAWGSFKNWALQVKLPTASGDSYSWVCRAADIHKFFALSRECPRETLIDIGRAKLTRLIPLVRKGCLTEEVWTQALDPDVSDLMLREALRCSATTTKKVDQGNNKIFVTCPRCGEIFGVENVAWL